MTKSICPYKKLPDSAFWSRSIAKIALEQVDPVITTPFLISRTDKVATAGSCFAQHIARYIRGSGFNYFVSEDCMRFVPDDVKSSFNYGTFSARFGNIYTSRQLLQLFNRAYDLYHPTEDYWIEDGRFIDPFRPFIQPHGFATLSEFAADRVQHFAAVRNMFESCDIFVFTLGLTETWEDQRDGAVFPVCPGCGAGEFIPERYAFKNLDYIEILEDMKIFIDCLRNVNPAVRIILTVSPVPLIASASSEHVLSATTYSKSVLRAVAGKLAITVPNLAYFPSYEIITGSYNRGSYYESDLRGVTEAGVKHVMSIFFKHFYQVDIAKATTPLNSSNGGATQLKNLDNTDKEYTDRVRVICDEETLEQI